MKGEAILLDPTKGRVVMISGASRGIGLALAETLHAKGHMVSAGACDVTALTAALSSRAGRRLLCARYDAGDLESHAIWLEATLEKFGRLDALVNNAGPDAFSSAGGEEDHDALWTVNLKGPLFLTRICLPHLKACGAGRIINVAPLSCTRVSKESVAYNVTKYALMALTHGTRRLGWEDGVRATALCPGFLPTDLTTSVARDETVDPYDLAELAARVIALPNTTAMAEMLVKRQLEEGMIPKVYGF
jgi:NAD(P)-dependent dehydrogenase (short-subunit alcohol dehydrogenase family)